MGSDEDLKEGLWDHPWIPWVFSAGSLALGGWFIGEGAWWQWIVGIFFFCLAAMSLKQAVLLTMAKLVARRLADSRVELDQEK